FQVVKNELHHIESKREGLKKKQKEQKLSKGDPLYEEYQKEIRNLYGVKKNILRRQVLEHLTNEGVLPNYAFPETGAVLNAHVMANKAEGSQQTEPNKEFEIVRSASQAIKEFAPENYFYTQGYRFQIDGLNNFERSDPENQDQKRFCS